jgi:hypothetical protein
MAVRKVEEEIGRLGALRDAPESEAAPALAVALDDRVNLIVAKAAAISRDRGLRGLVPNLLLAFGRLLEHGAQRDPQCWGKHAIARALVALDHRESAPYLRGLRHIQMEPAWGGQADTAANLRGTCVLALAACPDIPREETLRAMVDALADPADLVRAEAVRALTQTPGEEGALLLRLKARVGDKALQVAGQVVDGLLALAGEGAVAFVAGFLKDADEAVCAEAALSLGSSRLAGAVEALIAGHEETRDPEWRQLIFTDWLHGRTIPASAVVNRISEGICMLDWKPPASAPPLAATVNSPGWIVLWNVNRSVVRGSRHCLTEGLRRGRRPAWWETAIAWLTEILDGAPRSRRAPGSVPGPGRPGAGEGARPFLRLALLDAAVSARAEPGRSRHCCQPPRFRSYPGSPVKILRAHGLLTAQETKTHQGPADQSERRRLGYYVRAHLPIYRRIPGRCSGIGSDDESDRRNHVEMGMAEVAGYGAGSARPDDQRRLPVDLHRAAGAGNGAARRHAHEHSCGAVRCVGDDQVKRKGSENRAPPGNATRADKQKVPKIDVGRYVGPAGRVGREGDRSTHPRYAAHGQAGAPGHELRIRRVGRVVDS